MPEREPVESPEDAEGGGRPFWSGMLSFGLVSIPVDLLPAHHHSRAPLRMLDADGTPLGRRYYCPEDEKEVDSSHLVRGFPVGSGKRGGKFIVVTDEELEGLAPKKSREIDLRLFVDRDRIDSLYFEHSYFLAPGKSSGKAYRLLVAVMEDKRRAGIATFVMRDKEYLVAIFAEGGLLRAETLRFVDEVRSASDVGLPKRAKLDEKAVARLRRAVSSLAEKSWNPADLSDPHQPLRDLAARKLKQKKDVVTASESGAERSGTVVTDLMEVLRQSLAENDLVKRGSGRSSTRTGTARSSSSSRSAAGGRPRRSSKAPSKPSRRSARSQTSSTRQRTQARKSAPGKAGTRSRKKAARRRSGA